MSDGQLNSSLGLRDRGLGLPPAGAILEPVVFVQGVATWPLLADRMAGRRKPDDGYLRETFTLPRDLARTKARDFLTRYPKAAYMSGVESWRELSDGRIEFTMRRLRSAD